LPIFDPDAPAPAPDSEIPPAPADTPDDLAGVDLDDVADTLRAGLTSGEVMHFELECGVTMDQLTRTNMGQLGFMYWATRVHTDHAVSVRNVFQMSPDALATAVMEYARRLPKVDGSAQRSATPTGNVGSNSPSSDSPITSP
jgi:hypothetical protein